MMSGTFPTYVCMYKKGELHSIYTALSVLSKEAILQELNYFNLDEMNETRKLMVYLSELVESRGHQSLWPDRK